MRRFSFGLALTTMPAFALFSLILAGCGGGKDTGPAAGGGGGKGVSSDQGAMKQELKILNPGKGVLKGKITLKGQPDLKALTQQLQDKIKATGKDVDFCLKAPETESAEQAYRISDKGLLGNVFVWVIPEKSAFFKVTEEQLKALPKQVETHQPHCAFIPHCVFHFSRYHPDPKKPREEKPTGQIWVVHNDAAVIGHNTNYTGGSKNKGDNVILPSKAPPRKIDNLVPESKEMTITCNIHPWMKAFMRVVDTPYYAISLSDTLADKDKVEKGDARFGTYEIKGLPEGKVRVLAWHEECGYLNKNTGQGEEIEIQTDKPTERDFEATAK